MMVKKFSNAEGGAAIAIKCVTSQNKSGFGKPLKSGMVEFYVPPGISAIMRNELILQGVMDVTKCKSDQVEIIVGKHEKLLVTIINFDPAKLNRLIT